MKASHVVCDVSEQASAHFALQSDESTAERARMGRAEVHDMELRQRRQAQRRLRPTEDERRAAERKSVVERAGVEVFVAEQHDCQAAASRKRGTCRGGDREFARPLAAL